MTFKSSSIIFIIVISVTALLHYFLGINLMWLLAPVIIYQTVIIYGSASIQSGFHIPAYCCSLSSENKIAITFDDGPHEKYTAQVLSILAAYQATATFFVIGKNIAGNENILKQIHTEGHILGNHSYTHSFFMDFKNVQGFKDELNQTSDDVFQIIGKRMKLFRPPYGVTTPHLAQASTALDYSIIGWNIRSLDTTKHSAEIITRRVLTQVKPGAIILFHDSSDKTVQVLKQTLDFAKQNGFEMVSVAQLLNLKAYG
jgi:peptidoglycan/xylan/chitin deacetylase (PgdA/CDA1 family)